MWPVIVLIGVGCALLLESDSPRPREQAEPPSPPSPPPPPAPDAGVTPRGVDPSIFLRPPPSNWPQITPYQAMSNELQALFDRAYRLDERNRLVVRDQTQVTTLQARLDELNQRALTDPRFAREYDRSEINRFVYLTHSGLSTEDRGLLYRMIKGQISIADAVREIDWREIRHAMDYNGRTDLSEDSFSRRHTLMGHALRQIAHPITLAEALRISATAITEDTRLVPNATERTQLGASSEADLRREYNRLSSEWMNRPEGRERADAYRRLTYLSFILTSKGLANLADAPMRDCRARFIETSEADCRDLTEIQQAIDTPGTFDNGRLLPVLLDRVNVYIRDYLGQNVSQRISQSSLLLDGDLGRALTSGQFGLAVSPETFRAMLQAQEQATGLSHIPPTRPMTLADIRAITEPVQIRLSDLPQEWRNMAAQIQVRIPRPNDGSVFEGTLWSYLQQNVDTVALTRHGPQLGADLPEAQGTALRMMRTVIIDVDGSGAPGTQPTEAQDPNLFHLFATLAHEAYHNDFFHNHLPQDPRLARANTLNERNAHFLEAQVLQEVLRFRAGALANAIRSASTTGITEVQADARADELIFLMGRSADHRLVGLSANIPLDYERNYRDLTDFVFDDVRIEDLGAYPTTFKARYLARLGLSEDRFLSREMETLIATEWLRPLADRVRRHASGSPSGTSTAGSH